MSGDYQQGYRDGYRDGWDDRASQDKGKLDPAKQYEEYKKMVEKAAERDSKPVPLGPHVVWPAYRANSSCSKCGMVLTDPMGRPIALSYTCNVTNCPTFPQVTC